jgi:hypothetical protein
MGCVLIAVKIDEINRKTRDIAAVFEQVFRVIT